MSAVTLEVPVSVGIGVQDLLTGNIYNVYPAHQRAYCTPGDNLRIGVRITNTGTVDITLSIAIGDDEGKVLMAPTAKTIPVGGSQEWVVEASMPNRAYQITVGEATHPDIRFTFTVYPPGTAPDMTLVGLGIVVATVAIVYFWV